MHRQTCHIDRLLSTAVAGSMCTPGLTVTDKGIILTRIQWMSLSLYVYIFQTYFRKCLHTF